MAYDLHIEGRGPIPLAEWHEAISATNGVRLFEAPAYAITNPKTGEVISIGKRAGDAEVYFADKEKWHPVFRWRDGSAMFTVRFQPGDKSHPAWVAAVSLARYVRAEIRGDSGEIYDLETGVVADG